MAKTKMTEQEFFDRCDEVHRAFFGDLMARWRSAGKSVQMQASSASLKSGKTTFCSLYPSYRNKGGAARFDLTRLGKAFGKNWADGLTADLRAIEGLKVGSGTKDLVVERPADMNLEIHEAFKQALLQRS